MSNGRPAAIRTPSFRSLLSDATAITTNVLIYDQTFENCRFCIMGCGEDHPVFWGFVECDKHRAKRLRYLQQEYELAERSQSLQAKPSVREEKRVDQECLKKKKLDWKDRFNAKLVQSCKVMDALSTECLQNPPTVVQAAPQHP